MQLLPAHLRRWKVVKCRGCTQPRARSADWVILGVWCAGAIDVSTGDAFLFMPRLPESFSVWFGELPTPASVRSKYGVQVS